MIGLAHRRAALGCLVVVMLAVAAGQRAGAADELKTQPVSAQLFYVETDTATTCGWGIGVEFGDVPGAASYTISFWDGYYQQQIVKTVLPKDVAGTDGPLLKEHAIAKGQHFMGYTGGNTGKGPDGCTPNPLAGDPTEGGRFSKGATAFATFPPDYKPKKYTLSGTVQSRSCGESSCRTAGVPGVVVTASGPETATATTSASGAYSMEVPNGSYTVVARLAGHDFDPDRPQFAVKDANVSGVDFRTCGSTHNGVRALAAAGRTDAGAFCRLLTVDLKPRPTSNAELEKVPVKFGYAGKGWDPKGGPIVITWDGKKAKTFPAAETFDGKIYATEWPVRNRDGCSGTVAATQAGRTSAVPLRTPAIGQVVFADNDRVLRAGDPICGGELFVLEHTSGTVVVSDGTLLYLYQADGNRLPGFDAASTCVTLVPASRGKVRIVRHANGVVQAIRGCG